MYLSYNFTKTILLQGFARNISIFTQKLTTKLETKTSQLVWTYGNLKQQWAYPTQTMNQMEKRLGTESILREEKSQWWENTECIINCKSSIWISQSSEVQLYSWLLSEEATIILQIYPGDLACLIKPVKNVKDFHVYQHTKTLTP